MDKGGGGRIKVFVWVKAEDNNTHHPYLILKWDSPPVQPCIERIFPGKNWVEEVAATFIW